LRRKRLMSVLAQKTNLPIYALKGQVNEMTNPVSILMIDFLILLFSIVILIGFFIIQVWLEHNTTGSLHTILLILTICTEIWVVATCVGKSYVNKV